ncbi:MAG TPA: type VI secretion system tube protein TssD [Hymenobacter sp.]|jgi:hypothetical protein|uniref:type VI secretion system tube protein TssD n=1 Tax=Hymenobacter sp. TaxID=1898978 RepID=UPI002ED87D92
MPSFYAELKLAGIAYRVVRCQYACHQSTDARGRANAKVRHALLTLTLDVPDDDALLAWAAAPFKALAGEVVFYSATQLVAHETIAFAAGQCVGYAETFESGAGRDGAYVCHLTVAAPSFELRRGGPGAVAAVAARVLPTLDSPSVTGADTVAIEAGAAVGPALLSLPPAEYSFDEFKATIWGSDKVPTAVIEQLYAHFNAARASRNPAPQWAKMESLVRASTYIDGKGLQTALNGGWPPAFGGFNKRLVQPAPPDTFDRYQKDVDLDEEGQPALGGTFTSPVPADGALNYEARALEGEEKDYDLMYEIKVLKPFPFQGEEADIIPWHGHEGNGVQTRMLFPPKDPATGQFPWTWQRLQKEKYIEIKYKSSPSGKFLISPDGTSLKAASV